MADQFQDEDTEDLFASPSQKAAKEIPERPKTPRTPRTPTGLPKHEPSPEERDENLRRELEGVRNINELLEGVIGTLERAKGNMETVSKTVDTASTLLNTWTRILSQTEHNQRLILNPTWKGATQDLLDIENEAAQKQLEAERKAAEEERRRTEAARRIEEAERQRVLGAHVLEVEEEERPREGPREGEQLEVDTSHLTAPITAAPASQALGALQELEGDSAVRAGEEEVADGHDDTISLSMIWGTSPSMVSFDAKMV